MPDTSIQAVWQRVQEERYEVKRGVAGVVSVFAFGVLERFERFEGCCRDTNLVRSNWRPFAE